jgi:hypothetical protein
MKEANLRKWHRGLGIILALFVILQAGSGLLITITEIETPHSHANSEIAAHGQAHEEGKEGHHDEGQSAFMKFLSFIHHGAGSIGVIYRILLGIGLLFMAVTGAQIYLNIKARTRRG